MIAIVPVRSGALPLGGREVAAEAGDAVLLIGSDCRSAVPDVERLVPQILVAEVGTYRPGAWADALADLIPSLGALADVVLLPHSADGRDLAPRVASALGRPLVAGALEVHRETATVARQGGVVMEHVRLAEPTVVTLQPGVRSVEDGAAETSTISDIHLEISSTSPDPQLLRELPADPATMDLSEAPRIIGGGAGLGSPAAFELLENVSVALGASMGGTRVVMDWGWIPFERQIGTTGVTVDPDLYIALGISGAVQHTSGLGAPHHIVSVNTDPHCPMMTLADLAVVCDAPAFLAALSRKFEAR